ncbi:MAG: F0F1 ATP synthase subunit delta [Acetobacteraceae bacterium]
MRIDWWTLGLQAVNALVLIWILARFLFRPVAAIIDERRGAARRLLDEADARRAAAEKEQRLAAEEADRQARARGEVLKTAAMEAEAEKSVILADAQAGADHLRAAAEADIARVRREMAASVSDRASRLAVDITARLLTRLPETSRIAGFIDGLAAALAVLPATTQAGIGADGAPVRLKAARALSDAEAEACRMALGRVLGRRVTLAVEVDPALIAGLEIETPHAVVRNSFRADLDRIAAELTHDGQ